MYLRAAGCRLAWPWANGDRRPAHLKNQSFEVSVSPGAMVQRNPISLSNHGQLSVFVLKVMAATTAGTNLSLCYLTWPFIAAVILQFSFRVCVANSTLFLRLIPSLSSPYLFYGGEGPMPDSVQIAYLC